MFPRLKIFLAIVSALIRLLFLVAGVFLVVFYRFSIIISHLRDANIALAQRVAILEFRLENVEDGRL